MNKTTLLLENIFFIDLLIFSKKTLQRLTHSNDIDSLSISSHISIFVSIFLFLVSILLVE